MPERNQKTRAKPWQELGISDREWRLIRRRNAWHAVLGGLAASSTFALVGLIIKLVFS